MAKTNMKARERRRISMSKKARSKRELLKSKIKDQNLPYEEKMVFVAKLMQSPRDESPSRVRNRCRVCGRSRGVYKKFKLCRIHLREAMVRGDVPGLVKASW
jgi:small subunit ribosomal protein S14